MSMAIQRAKYTGDPGLWDVFKKVGRAAVGMIPIVGPALSELLPSKQPPIPQAGPGRVPLALPAMPISTMPITRMPVSLAPTVTNGARFNPFDPLGLFAPKPGPGVAPAMVSANGACDTAGYHLNKSAYFLMSGEFVPERSRYVRNRKRNPANARATSRAISRITGAKRYAASLSRISIRKKC